MKQNYIPSKFATKTDLKRESKILRAELLKIEEQGEILQDKFQELKNNVDENARKYRDQILTRLDEVMGELQTMRDEDTIGTHQIRELRKDVDAHEKKIKALQQTTPAA